ncbi:MAG: FAD-dependent oxidoreductase, partial [Alphaproteobacteria bacterium]|nr:FAD-dependent oxidoreductase [Alphaproteobacteria bacterium]
YGGYVTAEVDGSRTIGSTFDRMSNIDESSFEVSDDDSVRIIDQFEAITGVSRTDLTMGSSWAGVRATTPDHLPYAGPVADHASAQERYAALAQDAKTQNLGKPELVPDLYLLAGLGSKGYQYGPILGEYLAAQMCDEPLPLPTDLIAPLHPLRDLIRSIKRS